MAVERSPEFAQAEAGGPEPRRRVRIHRLAPRDTGDLAEMLVASADFHRGWVSYPTEPRQVADFVANAGRGGVILWGVRRIGDGMLVGLATLGRIAGEPWLSAEYGCAADHRHRGRGYLTEATDLCARYAFDVLGLHRVEALVQPTNVASARMLAAAGFRPEGTARGAVRIDGNWVDHVRWAVIADDRPVGTTPMGAV